MVHLWMSQLIPSQIVPQPGGMTHLAFSFVLCMGFALNVRKKNLRICVLLPPNIFTIAAFLRIEYFHNYTDFGMVNLFVQSNKMFQRWQMALLITLFCA